MPRKSLTVLLDDVDTSEPATTPADSRPAAHADMSYTGTPTDGMEGPRYLEYTRKEARFTDAQLADLGVLTRKLNKARKGRGERITDNTLIRVAVDLILDRADELAGHDESQLRRSLGL